MLRLRFKIVRCLEVRFQGQRKVSKMSYRLTRDQGNAKPSLRELIEVLKLTIRITARFHSAIIPPPPPLDAELMSSEELRKTSMEELIALIKRDSNQT